MKEKFKVGILKHFSNTANVFLISAEISFILFILQKDYFIKMMLLMNCWLSMYFSIKFTGRINGVTK